SQPSLTFHFSLLFSIFSLFTLFFSLSLAPAVHTSFLSSFNYSVHQFLHFFQLFCQPSLTLQFSILPHTPSLCFTPFSLLSIFSLFTLSSFLLPLFFPFFTLL